MDFDPILWSVLLLIVGCALVALEIFLPSGGIIGFLAATAFVAAIVMAFYNGGPVKGALFLLGAMVLLPTVVAVAFKYWPHTPIGRRLLLSIPSDEDTLPRDEKAKRQKSLVGKIGVAKSKMLPSGAVVIEGKTVDAVSQGMAIDAGQKVVVLEVKGNRVVVRPAKESQRPSSQTGDDLLSQPLDALGIDNLDDPLA